MKKQLDQSKICKICHKEFTKTPGQSYKQWDARIYCSIKCSSIGFTGFKQSGDVKKKLTDIWLDRPKPWINGSNNHFWKGGVYKLHRREKDRFMHSLAYKTWRRNVLERDMGKCVVCSSTENLHAHHIKPYRKHMELSLEINNGTTLCFSCHKKTHSYGSKVCI